MEHEWNEMEWNDNSRWTAHVNLVQLAARERVREILLSQRQDKGVSL